ncbi:MAG: putative CoA-binding protein [Myxococcota bacterium]|jgi:predicted CoA-binding protein
MLIHTDLSAIKRILEATRTVAVLGAHTDQDRAAFYVPEYLNSQGYRVLPVNPTKVGTVLWGEPVVAALSEVTTTHGAIDMVDVFRPSHALAGHVDEILAMSPLPKVVWFQLGIQDDAVARTLVEAGIDVVQSRCTLADHRAFGLPSVAS